MRHLVLTSFLLSTAGAQGTWLQATPATIPPARQGHGLAFDPASQRVVMFGGALSSGWSADLWQWTATGWNALAASGTPPVVRSNCGFCSDPAGGLLLFGGFNPGLGGIISPPNVRNDTWRLQQGAWTQLFPATSPGARQWPAMVTTQQGVLLFGGSGLYGPVFGDTWRWNGTTWTQLTPATSPPARHLHCMAFDAARGVVVLFGGRDSNLLGMFADTWEWDGSNWAQRSPVHSPPALIEAAMAFSPATNRTVLFGSPGGNGVTWTWDGIDWQQLPTTGVAFARWNAPLVFAPGNQGAVLFGGRDATSVRSETFQFLETAASLTSFGSGCPGPNALVPSLAAAPGELPRLGTTMHLRVDNLPASFTLPVLALGLSNTVSGGPPPYPLPLDLGWLGWPGCLQLVSLEVLTAAASFGASVDFPFVVPPDPVFVGFTFHGQVFVLYPSNAAAVSNGVTAVVGV